MPAEEQNQQDVQKYLEYCDTTRQNCTETVSVRRNQLRYLTIWAGDTTFGNTPKIKNSFPNYLANLYKTDSINRVLCPSAIKATLNTSRMFFHWAVSEYPESYSEIRNTWIDSLRLPRHIAQCDSHKEHEYYTMEEIQRIAALTPVSLAEKRGRAAMVFLFLSGMRVGAFLTLPISCVDLVQSKIYQFPSKGVATKFHKSSVTTLLNIPELLQVVKEWDEEIRRYYPGYQTWFAPIRPQRENAGHFFNANKKASPYRGKEFRREMLELCKRAGVPFRSAHKLRHGHAMFGIKNAQNIQELKAISQNLMHSSISITDGIYGNLSGGDFIETVNKLGTSQYRKTTAMGISEDLIRVILKLQENPLLIQKLLDT